MHNQLIKPIFHALEHVHNQCTESPTYFRHSIGAIKYQQLLDELSSVQLIIQMLNKEYVKEDAIATSIQQMEAESEV